MEEVKVMFDKKPKEEKKIEIPVSKLRVRESSGGKYVLNEKNQLVFRKTTIKKVFDPVLREWIEQKPEIEDLTPEQMNWTKKIEDCLVIKKLVPSRTQLDGVDAIFFLQRLEYKIRDEMEFVYLTREEKSRKIYLKDFETSVCFQCPHNSGPYHLVEILEERPITKSEILKLHKEGKISDVYSDVLEHGKQKLYRKDVFA
jgi:hypothetical protein